MTDPRIAKSQQSEPSLDSLLEKVTGDRFKQWYRERQYRQNIQNGQSYFNNSGYVPDPDRHTPSQLLQCHRQILYRQENAPAERPDPRGIFWVGEKFEEDLLFPFLDQAASEQAYIQNSIWIDFTVETAAGDIQIKGSTDPVFVDEDAAPILPTEAKTKSDLENLTSPNRHHRAQIHSYLVGLSEKFEKDLSDALIIYGSRESLDLKTFHVTFDDEFWREVVVEWATEHTEYRLNDDLPPASPEYDWECRFCAFRNRCGKGDTSHSDYGPDGFLPEFDEYPKEKVIEYLEGHPGESLTPALAQRFPDLAEAYEVSNWYCDQCDSEIEWESVDSDGDPVCPLCAERGDLSVLTSSAHHQQSTMTTEPKGESGL